MCDKKILRDDGYVLNTNSLLLNTLTKACRLVNDTVSARLPIKCRLLEKLMFEPGCLFEHQPYLHIMYKCLFILAYYGLFRIGELTLSQHSIKARNISLATNKDKLLITLFTSKTHNKESRSQKIKISAIEASSCNVKVKYKNRFFCPFKTVHSYIKARGSYFQTDDENFFIFRDRSPVKPEHAGRVLRSVLTANGLDTKLFNFHSLRMGRATELIQLGYSIEIVKRLGRWKSNAVYKYIKE